MYRRRAVGEKRCYCCATLITDANKCYTAGIKEHYCRDCMHRAIADHTMKILTSNNTQRINQDIEHPSALPPARPGGGQITPKPLEVVVMKGRKAVVYCGPDRKGAQIKISDEDKVKYDVCKACGFSFTNPNASILCEFRCIIKAAFTKNIITNTQN